VPVGTTFVSKALPGSATGTRPPLDGDKYLQNTRADFEQAAWRWGAADAVKAAGPGGSAIGVLPMNLAELLPHLQQLRGEESGSIPSAEM
jgi:hypothetical protein